MKPSPLLLLSFAIISVGLHTTTLLARTGQGESLGDYARRMRACKNFPPLCKDEAAADAVRQIEPLDEKQLGRFVLRFRDLDKDFPERAEWEHDLFTGKQTFVKAYRDMQRIKESCQSSQGAVPPDCAKRLAETQETLTRAKADFLRNVEVGQDYALTRKPEAEAGKTWEKPSDVSQQTKRQWPQGAERGEGQGSSLTSPSAQSTSAVAQHDYAAARRTDTGPGAVYAWVPLANGDLVSDWKNARIIDVYGGDITLSDSIVANRSGLVKGISVRITNSSREAVEVKFTVKCGAWSKEEDIVIEPNQTLEGASLVFRRVLRPHYDYDDNGNRLTSYVPSKESEYHNFTYTPEGSCNNVTLDALDRDVQLTWH